MIFVYGSLMEEFFNFHKYLEGKVVKIHPGRTEGNLFHLENKGFPGMVSGYGDVYGEIMWLDDEAGLIERLDALEGFRAHGDYGNMYNRVLKEVEDLDEGHTYLIYAYEYNQLSGFNMNDVKIPIRHGDWKKYLADVI